MIAPADPKPQRWLAGWQPLLIAGAVFVVVMCVIVAKRAEGTTDFRDYWQTAVHFQKTGQITEEHGVHNYLPFFAIFMTPWSFLPLRVAIVLFTLMSLGLLGLTITMVEMLLNNKLGAKPRRALLITLGLILAYVVSSSVLATVNILVLFLIIATWFLVERGHEWQAGVPLGLAVLIKVLPAALIVFFLLNRRWRVAGVSLATIVILGFGLPLLSIGPEQTIARHRQFRQTAMRDHSAYSTIHAEKPLKAKYNNNSLPIVLRHLLTRIDANAGEVEDAIYVNFAELPPRAIWWLYMAVMLVLVGATLFVTLRGPPKWPPDSIDDGRVVRAQFGLWTCLMLIASPLLWTHYIVWAYWPLAVVTDHGERYLSRTRRIHVWSASALLVWLAGAILLAWPAARATGAQMAALIVLWGILLRLSMRAEQT
ncbi:MAG: glycosyltransferase family 87 protein [Planctomycetota bacterium]